MAFDITWLEPAQETFGNPMSTAKAFDLRAGRGKSTKIEGLFKQVTKCVELLITNPRHPGIQLTNSTALRIHTIGNKKFSEAYAQNRTPGAYRIFWCYGPGKNQITIIAITPHP